MEGLTYADLPSILPIGRKVVYQKASTSHARVYRTKIVKRTEYPGWQLAALRDAEAPMITPLEWQTSEEPLDGPDDFMSKTGEHVVAGGSMCCLGPAGAGKSVTLRAAKATIEERGHTVAAICLTHSHTGA